MSTSPARPRVLAVNTDDGILTLIAAALTEAGLSFATGAQTITLAAAPAAATGPSPLGLASAAE